MLKRKRKKKMLTGYSKLADWDDDEPSALPETSSRWSKVVVLKHMFTLAEIDVRITFLSTLPTN